MKDKKNVVFLIIAIIVFLIALIFCLKVYFFNKVNQNETESTEQTEISKTKDIENTSNKDGVIIYKSDGSEVNLSDYKDSPMVLLFFNFLWNI